MAEIACPIHHWAETRPDLAAVITADRTVSFEEYDALIAATASRLEARGLARGEVLGLSLSPSLEYLLLVMASMRLGAIACPVNPRWPMKRIVESLQATGCRRLVLPERTALEGLSVETPGELVVSKEISDTPSRAPELFDDDQPVTIIFTSGSSGMPKAALHAYGNHYANAVASNRNLPVVPGDRWLLSLPLFHVAGMGVLFRCMAGGGAVVIPTLGEAIEDAVERYGVTHVSLVSTQLYRLLQNGHAVRTLQRVKGILLGGGPMPSTLIRRAHELNLPVCVSYGLTEMASQVTTTRPGDPIDALLTPGRPIHPGSMKLADDGEILVRGPALFLGYIEAGTCRRPMTENGWFRTGDLGRLDAEDRLIVTGRKDNRFVCGGENIQPEEIERGLCQIPAILDAIVVPLADEEYGAVPAAFVRLTDGANLDEDGLRRRLETGLPRFQIPRRFFPWPADRDSALGKVGRAALAALARDLAAAHTAP